MLVSADDITFSSESLEFTPTVTSFTVTVTAVTDNEVEGDETFNLTLFTTAMNVALPTVTINVIDLTGERRAKRYQCQSFNSGVVGVERGSLSLSLSLLSLPPSLSLVELVESPQSQGVVVGDPVTMTCSYEAGYGIDIEWQDGDGNTIPGGTTTAMPRPGGGNISSSSLTINSVQFDDCGSFRCSAAGNLSSLADLSVVGKEANLDTHTHTHTHTHTPLTCIHTFYLSLSLSHTLTLTHTLPLSLFLAPEFLSTSDLNPTLSVGAVALLSCSIRSCGPFTIDWVINNDTATQTPFPTNITNSPAEGSPLLTDTTSVVTINTVGVINSGTAQSCDVLYDEETPAIDSRIFNFTLESES